MLSNCGVGEDSWESLDSKIKPVILKEITPNIHWKDWWWSWSSNTLATWCQELTHLGKTLTLGKIEGWRIRGRQRMRWLDGFTDWWTWIRASSRSWWRAGKPGVLQSNKELDTNEWLKGTELNGAEEELNWMGQRKNWGCMARSTMVLAELIRNSQSETVL